MKVALPLIPLLAACTSMSAVPAPLTGEWAGVHVGLRLTAAGGTLDYDCAHGTIGPVVVSAGGRFTAGGTHTPEHGGPVRQGEVPPSLHASFEGRVSGDRMTLTGRLDDGAVLGPFALRRGAQPTIFRCL